MGGSCGEIQLFFKGVVLLCVARRDAGVSAWWVSRGVCLFSLHEQKSPVDQKRNACLVFHLQHTNCDNAVRCVVGVVVCVVAVRVLCCALVVVLLCVLLRRCGGCCGVFKGVCVSVCLCVEGCVGGSLGVYVCVLLGLCGVVMCVWCVVFSAKEEKSHMVEESNMIA